MEDWPSGNGSSKRHRQDGQINEPPFCSSRHAALLNVTSHYDHLHHWLIISTQRLESCPFKFPATVSLQPRLQSYPDYIEFFDLSIIVLFHDHFLRCRILSDDHVGTAPPSEDTTTTWSEVVPEVVATTPSCRRASGDILLRWYGDLRSTPACSPCLQNDQPHFDSVHSVETDVLI